MTGAIRGKSSSKDGLEGTLASAQDASAVANKIKGAYPNLVHTIRCPPVGSRSTHGELDYRLLLGKRRSKRKGESGALAVIRGGPSGTAAFAASAPKSCRTANHPVADIATDALGLANEDRASTTSPLGFARVHN